MYLSIYVSIYIYLSIYLSIIIIITRDPIIMIASVSLTHIPYLFERFRLIKDGHVPSERGKET